MNYCNVEAQRELGCSYGLWNLVPAKWPWVVTMTYTAAETGTWGTSVKVVKLWFVLSAVNAMGHPACPQCQLYTRVSGELVRCHF